MRTNASAVLSYGEAGKPSFRALDDVQSTNDSSIDAPPSQSLLDVLPEMHTQILGLYKRSLVPSSAEQAPAICLSDSVLRLAKFLCDVYTTGGLDLQVLAANALGLSRSAFYRRLEKYRL